MKCPVCDNVNTSMLCPRCGFDSSKDYGKYPTFGPVGNIPPVSGLRKRYLKKQKKPSLRVVMSNAMKKLKAGNSTQGNSVETAFVEQHEPRKTNILRSDKVPRENNGFVSLERSRKYPVFGSRYQRGQIHTVTFVDTLECAPKDAWDVSEAGNGTVMAWVRPCTSSPDKFDGLRAALDDYTTERSIADKDRSIKRERPKLYDLYIGAEGGVWAGDSCGSMFAGYHSVQKFVFGDAFHTEDTEDMSWMFGWCANLTDLCLLSFDTANVQDMSWMFSACKNLRTLDLRGFDTANVRDMSRMFCVCKGLVTLELSSFDTTNVQNMNAMFAKCELLTWIDLDSFNTANVRDMKQMFEGCANLCSFDAADLKNMRGCVTAVVNMLNSRSIEWSSLNLASLRSLNLSGFNTVNVRNMSEMFCGCGRLRSLDICSFDTQNVKHMDEMFRNCRSLTKLRISDSFVTANVDTVHMFLDCPAGDDYQHLLN